MFGDVFLLKNDPKEKGWRIHANPDLKDRLAKDYKRTNLQHKQLIKLAVGKLFTEQSIVL